MVRRRIAALWVLFCVGLGFTAGAAEAGGARLYEVTENMKLMARGADQNRVATAQLLGFADRGTPLCPDELPGTEPCVINATGEDVVSFGDGFGIVRGRFTVVVHGDNPVDGPELVVLRGRFKGSMDFSPALLDNMPFGTVTGHFKVNHQTFPFSGTFRLPFKTFVDSTTGEPCDPAAHTGCVETPALYLGLAETGSIDPGSVVAVAAHEYAIGFPTVRFDVNFQP